MNRPCGFVATTKVKCNPAPSGTDGLFTRPSKKPGLPLIGIPGSYGKIRRGDSNALKGSCSGVFLFNRKFLSDRAFAAQRETPNITVVQGIISFLHFA